MELLTEPANWGWMAVMAVWMAALGAWTAALAVWCAIEHRGPGIGKAVKAMWNNERRKAEAAAEKHAAERRTMDRELREALLQQRQANLNGEYYRAAQQRNPGMWESEPFGFWQGAEQKQIPWPDGTQQGISQVFFGAGIPVGDEPRLCDGTGLGGDRG